MYVALPSDFTDVFLHGQFSKHVTAACAQRTRYVRKYPKKYPKISVYFLDILGNLQTLPEHVSVTGRIELAVYRICIGFQFLARVFVFVHVSLSIIMINDHQYIYATPKITALVPPKTFSLRDESTTMYMHNPSCSLMYSYALS